MTRLSKIPEGAILGQIVGVGTRQCEFDKVSRETTDCDSWKTLGIGIFRTDPGTGEAFLVTYPLCAEHFKWVADHVWFNSALDFDQVDLSGEDKE